MYLTVRPSFGMPSMSGRTDAVEKALYLWQWGVPFDARASVFGRDAMFWDLPVHNYFYTF